MIEIQSSEPNVVIRKNNSLLREKLNSISSIRQNPLDDIDEDEYPWIVLNYGLWMNVRPCVDYSKLPEIIEFWNDPECVDCGTDEDKFFNIIKNYYNNDRNKQ